MEKYIIIILFILPITSFAQNWNLINLNETYNFKMDDSDVISNTVSVDSIVMNGNDSIFYLNRIVKDCPQCDIIDLDPEKYKISNQGQFLQSEITKFNNGFYKFNGDSEFFINPYLNIGSSWDFDTTQNIIAYVDTIYEQEILGSIDSIKIISTSIQDTIIISKNHGIIEFNKTEKKYILIGIEERNIGELMPRKKDFYNFNIGDVFQYKIASSSHFGPTKGIRKKSIIDKIENDSQFIYSIRILRRDTTTELMGIFYGFENAEYTVIYPKMNLPQEEPKQDDFLNSAYNNKLIRSSPYENPNEENEYRIIKMTRDSISGRISVGRGFYPLGPNYTPEKGYHFIGDSDSLIIFEYSPSEIYKEIYSVGLGRVYNYSSGLNNGTSSRLISYIKDGDTTGIIIPDDELILSNQRHTSGLNLSIYPNFSDGIYNILYPDYSELKIEVFNNFGQLVLLEKKHILENIQIDIRKEKTGLYFLKITIENQFKTFKILKY